VAVVGRRRTLELVLIGILAGGHVLLEDLPGLGKTLIARSFARVLGLDFARIQFTPDLLPSDVVGAPLYDQRNGEMVFRPGPVFTQLLLADEINRTPPKTQAALLEAMGEGQVSVDGQSPQAARSRSSSWPPTTRSSTRAPTSCPRPSSTGS
jgi:MoxR-like ATPase